MTPTNPTDAQLEPARKCAAKACSEDYGELILSGLYDHVAVVQSALLAIQATEARAQGLVEALRLAYGLLWHMQIDTTDDNLKLASDARQALLSVMSKDDQLLGIDAAKMTDGRFTGAA